MFEFITKLVERTVQTFTLIGTTSNVNSIDDDYVNIQNPQQVVKQSSNTKQPEVKQPDINSFTDDCIVEQDNGVICDACHVITRGDDRYIKMMSHVKTTHHQIMLKYTE